MRRLAILIAAAAPLALAAQSRPSHLADLYPNEFEPSQVRILDGPFLHAMEVNVNTLKAYDVDRLLAPFFIEAGMEPKAPKFENWAGLDGHVTGHYLSALAIHYAATGDQELLDRMQYMLDEMQRVQQANGDGYVGGVPESKQCWDDLRAGDITAISKRWVPWYNMHKVYAGLRDAYVYAGSEQALRMFLDLCDWGIGAISGLDDQQMEQMLNTEFGGMNEVYADAYALTGDKKYLDAAKRFTHHWLYDSMLAGVDNLDNNHANTQVPKVVGFQRVAEVDGCNPDYFQASDFFWDKVVNDRSIAIGGNSRREYFPSAADCVSYTEEREGPESCNTNNMLKLTEGLYRMRRDSRYADFYERAMFNHILSTQHPEHGGYVYFTSARPAHYRVYSQPNSAMWCCVGTGMENHGKYGQFIYTHSGDTLSVNLFVSSELDWDGVKVRQQTTFPAQEGTRILVDGGGREFALSIRQPAWCKGFEAKVNGQKVYSNYDPTGYLTIPRRWADGDVVEVSLPMEITLEEMPNVPSFVAIMRGPIVMAARMGDEDLKGLVADDGRWGHIASGKLIPLSDTPMLIGERADIVKRLGAMRSDDGLRYTVKDFFGKGQDLLLEPFANIHDSRYMMYWLTMTPAQWDARQAEMKAQEAERLRIDALTVDAVNFGEQQPEADHKVKAECSETGNWQGQSYRHAQDGWFSCELETKGNADLLLRARYWGNENGDRAFDIYIDDELLASCDNAHLTGKSEFTEVEYPIPASMLKGKDIVTVTYKARPGNYAGGLYLLRLVKKQ